MDHVSPLMTIIIVWPLFSIGVSLLVGAAIRFGSSPTPQQNYQAPTCKTSLP